MILVDTSVLSETSRMDPDADVSAWLIRHETQLQMPAMVLSELRYGVEKLDASRRRIDLKRWLTKISASFENRVLPFDAKAAEAHGILRARLKRIGKPMDAQDSYIAAIALSVDAAVATRNTRHFEHAGVKLIDPWAA